MIIGLTGQARSGKDTIAAYLVKEHGFERKAFADPLKKSVAALFDIPFSEVDKLKSDPGNKIKLVYEMGYEDGDFLINDPITFRTLLQRYGTEAHREVFGQNFWVDQTLPVDVFYGGRAIVVTDCRFSNEAERVKEVGGVVCRVWREQGGITESAHASEVIDFMWDYDIHNNGTLAQLYENIEEMLTSYLDRQEV